MNYNKPPAKSECARREHLPNPTKSSDLPRRGGAAARRFVFPLRRSVLGEPGFLAHRDFGADADDDGRLSAVDRAGGAAAGCCEEVALLILPRENGEGGPRVCAVEGASDSSLCCRRKWRVESDAPSTVLRHSRRFASAYTSRTAAGGRLCPLPAI